jgi:predicted phosphoadenosine phosphosulfate sulfurtransferase
MEFEEFTPAFGEWYAQDQLCACFVGIRTDESLNRYRSLVRRKSMFEGLRWTTWQGGYTYNAYPIYDWRTEDIWTYFGKTGLPYNRLYDRMNQAGLTIHQARICQPYGDDQRKGLWLYHIIEPETWGRVVARVNGANQGALYIQESGNMTGQRVINKPDHLTWREFAELILASAPPATADHYRNKIAVFLKWYQDRGYPRGIPDEGVATDKNLPSWTRVCNALLRNDYWCKGLSFTQNKTTAFAKYQSLMKRRRSEWNLI